MARRTGLLEDLLTLLTKLPWWVSVAFSAFVYVFFKWIFPTIEFQSITFTNLAQSLSNWAGYIAFIFLLPAPISFWHEKRRQLFNNQDDDEINICPRCSGRLILRTASKGQNKGRKFYGCSNFPNCRFTKTY